MMFYVPSATLNLKIQIEELHCLLIQYWTQTLTFSLNRYCIFLIDRVSLNQEDAIVHLFHIDLTFKTKLSCQPL